MFQFFFISCLGTNIILFESTHTLYMYVISTYFIYLMPALTNSFLSLDEKYLSSVKYFHRAVIQVVIGFMNAVQTLFQDEFKNNTKQIHKTY